MLKNYSSLLFFFLLPVFVLLGGCVDLSKSTAANDNAVPVLSVPLDDTLPATKTPDHLPAITLFVPLQGQLADAGKAIRDGFMMAHQNTAENIRPAAINVVDSSDLSQIQMLYNQAIQQDARFIVGPLAKPQVQAMAQVNDTSVPILALNYLDSGDQHNAQFYQFGLSPLDEAKQAAQLAQQSGKQNAMILVPEGSWGQSVADAFQTTWQQQGGTVVDTIPLSNSQPVLVQQIKQLATQRRKQYDVILLAAAPTVARQIKPLLKFYRVDDMPIYATAMIYDGIPKARQDHDLDGIIFCDVPWIFSQGSDADLKQKLATTYGTDFQNRTKLYGLGVDAYHVMLQFKAMTESQQTVAGATGNLTFDGHRMVRQLTCAQFRGGVPVLL